VNNKNKLVFIFGTRPEAIKMAPIILEARKDKKLEVKVISTGQHKEMVYQVLKSFGINVDLDLDIMKSNQTLFDISERCLHRLKPILEQEKPDYVFVQGDTTTAFITALTCFYLKIKVVHVEAGLRTDNKYNPFPEEINRRLITQIADVNFVPTKEALNNLLNSEVTTNTIYLVGNTVIDALFYILKKYKKDLGFPKNKRIILVTTHRRESLGKPMKQTCFALKEIASRFKEDLIVLPMHKNPKVRNMLLKEFSEIKNIKLVEPYNYIDFVNLMNQSYLIITDSGGVQEEAPSLGKPVLVIRETTERPEGIEAGTCKLVGTDIFKIVDMTTLLLTNKEEYDKISNKNNPYGDGKAAKRIIKIIKEVKDDKKN